MIEPLELSAIKELIDINIKKKKEIILNNLLLDINDILLDLNDAGFEC